MELITLTYIYPNESVLQKKLLENLHQTPQKFLVSKTMIQVLKQIEANHQKNRKISNLFLTLISIQELK